MKTFQAALAAVCLSVVSTAARAQTVQTFEDFSPCNGFPGNVGLYGSVNYLSQWTCFSVPMSPFNAHSGTNRVFASAGADNTSSASFTFAPTQFAGAWFAGDASIFFQLFLGATQVATSSSLAVSGTPAFLSSGYAGLVDRVMVVGSNEGFVMDDVTFSAVSIVTPEPASLLLVATGFAMIAGVRRRQRRRAPAT
jgi:hypothetical protein